MPDMKNKKVLIADDEVDIATILKVAFERQGYQVTVVDNGKKAMDEIQKEKPDLVVSDILMPIMNGFKLCELIKSEATTAKLPVILLTAVYRQEHHVEMGFKHGADAYFSKPFQVERVVEVGNKLVNLNSL